MSNNKPTPALLALFRPQPQPATPPTRFFTREEAVCVLHRIHEQQTFVARNLKALLKRNHLTLDIGGKNALQFQKEQAQLAVASTLVTVMLAASRDRVATQSFAAHGPNALAVQDRWICGHQKRIDVWSKRNHWWYEYQIGIGPRCLPRLQYGVLPMTFAECWEGLMGSGFWQGLRASHNQPRDGIKTAPGLLGRGV